MNLTASEMYYALLNKDPSYDGIFYAAIKTTGIFCRCICTARKPKQENVEFFSSAHDAILSGYRPCKICKPQYLPDQTPTEVATLLALLEENPEQKLSDYDLRQRGFEPYTIRRWFLKHHQMTFHAFQRMNRINMALKKLQEGESVINAAFDSGFESLSGFSDSFKAIFGVSPSKAKDKSIIYLNRIETPIGTMFAGATDNGLCLLEFTDRRMLETEFKHLVKRYNATLVRGDNVHIKQTKQQLNEYFSGKRQNFTITLDTKGTDFQKQVWQALMDIPYGTTRSYQEQAVYIGNPKAVRAVANANGMNQMSIIIPCHRVIGADGKLTGYGGGLWRKNWLLNLEKENR
ncbi:bifunctional transcriptional activator/DNA repair enzyme AdaA [Orbus sturtevantii]|uniref:bifunctional transcriptional activator/DNA repair enzyme AdaA n=1 Tax=Orbus sturtevantii TaxID=3074109 RepID=UPI00370DBAF5